MGAALPLVAAEPLKSGIDKGNISQTIKPGQDFFEYVNDGWLKNTPIPADKSNYGAFTILDDNTQAAVRKIIEEAAADKQAPAGSERQKVGDFYRTYMDIEARNKAVSIRSAACSMPWLRSKTNLKLCRSRPCCTAKVSAVC